MTSLCGVWWFSNTTYITSAFLKVKKSSSWKTLCLKRGSCYARVHSHGIARNECYGANERQLLLYINDGDLKLNAVAYAFSKISQPETC